jgi:hypothetical protein
MARTSRSISCQRGGCNMAHLPNYDTVSCVKCGRRYQLIDFGCAEHVLHCPDGYASQPELDAALLRHGYQPTKLTDGVNYPYPPYEEIPEAFQ